MLGAPHSLPSFSRRAEAFADTTCLWRRAISDARSAIQMTAPAFHRHPKGKSAP